MKIKTKVSIALICSAILMAFAIYLAYHGELFQNKESQNINVGIKKKVWFLTKSTDSAFWQSAYAGANAASTEYNMDLTCLGPENEEDYEMQNQMIENAIDEGVEAIVFSAIDYEKNAEAINKAAESGVKIIVVDSSVNSDAVECYIGTDNYEAGGMAGKAALEAMEEGLRIGIVNFAEHTKNGQSREEGFRDVIGAESRCEIVEAIHVQSSIESAKEGTKQMLLENPAINMIATFNEWTSLGVGYAVQEMGLKDKVQVIAFDSNQICVEMLETGEIDALIVQKPYAMGYLGVEKAYEVLLHKKTEQKEIITSSIIVNRQNMYNDECQRVLFDFDTE